MEAAGQPVRRVVRPRRRLEPDEVLLGREAEVLLAAHPAALIHNIPNRTTVSLNGPWQAIVDPYETGLNARFYLNAKPKDKHELVEYDFDKSDVLNVPGD